MITQAEFDEIKPGQLVNVQTYDVSGMPCILRVLNMRGTSLLGDVTLEVIARYSPGLVICLLPARKYNNGARWAGLGPSVKTKMGFDPDNLPFDSVKLDWIDLSREAIISIQPGKAKPHSPKETPPLPCAECKQFYPYAIANFGEQLICWGCRDSMGWKYGKDDLGKVYLK